MPDSHLGNSDFLHKITEIIEENLSDERFGVSELAAKIGMSRSNLLRRIKKLTSLSVSQLIRQVRLKNGMEMLRENSFTVSEVSFKVGFGSSSYFIKCFHDYYGYPPGEVGKRDTTFDDQHQIPRSPNKLIYFWEELIRRKVVRVITVYAAVAFIILELTDIVAPSLGLPHWTLNFIIILLCVGFILAVILTWIYDVTPQGIEKTKPEIETESENVQRSSYGWKIASYISFVIIIALILIHLIPVGSRFGSNPNLEKSIAVLPFKNDSNDSTNVYFINGLMESILNNLQKIEDVRVISRTSVEKYRNQPKSIPEIAQELRVSYLIEGSGQKIGDQIVLHIQLIEATSDRHIWSGRFKRETREIFELQSEVAMNIAEAIEAIITPEEEEQIDKIPTDNLVAYDYYLKGFDHLIKGDRDNLEEAIRFFEEAIAHDQEFSLAYAELAITY